ncbi:hypothetical protein A2643_01805 [Candidatus Nomurabacteria bacterium RIFCSPHIGHO2_01_FULL_39_220]|uniref:SHS2 domain-containing protein n=1 Tax=Candidatus Nomurabacteria bacterium RIFCSPLOWO2_02_FULL_40_67 TaxID=1801787 RepID=A0A1F6Y7G4_9BACT|nr:MAG: hypothetical protein UU01_C0006G0030 [Parcubacteria group bacterium GW2011_GWA2_40_37]KKS70922.1 MAG: hypothetical protein UV43_C0049G0003 [Parcubacteria group bacterium GW2011_GWF2_42_7]OGI62148.1 MAG: hypothetical protein A2W12_00915 [Candidatus Nomurabacteria bacterium RBG_16_40_11]OGI70562.1 MAG: hypothetical protein A2643_01805 [Candidatus Nomurabacteria bacterium RIFCSPHIGHO2_01_FULL_39_220]OGI72008.1 MAG: hypothetical protein A2W56_03195 [Candidatus Nomurabacteria bacterium RIFCS
MGIFGGNTEKGKLMLVLDVGSFSVGGALFWMHKSGVPKIVLSVREPIALEENVEANRLLFLTIKSLEVVLDRVYHSGFGAPKEIFCALSSPWHISETRVIKLERNMPFVFTSTLALDLIKKEIDLFEKEYLAKYEGVEHPVRSIEFKNIKTMLNGYETTQPLDQKGKELEMTIFISISPEVVLKKIEKIIQMHFYHKEIQFFSSVMATFVVVRDVYAHNENFLLIDIGGEVTDIFMVKKNVLRESISFPLGLNFIIRRVAETLFLSLNEAKSLVSLFKDGHASGTAVKKIGPIIEKLKNDWLLSFQNSLSNLTNDISVPANIYLSVDAEMASFFSETIKTEQFSQYTLTESKFTVTFLGTEVFKGMAEFKEGIIRDPALAINSIYINRFSNKI